MALSSRQEFDNPFAPGDSEPFVLLVNQDRGMPHWLIYTWADDERDHQEKLELVDDLGRTTWPLEDEPHIR